MNHDGKRIIFITGASSGIGAALAEYYANPDTTLGLVSRDSSGLGQVAEVCKRVGASTYNYVVDVTDGPALKKAAEHFMGEAGDIDIVIANAGIRGEEDDDYQNLELPNRIMNVNYMGVINTFSPFVKHFKTKGSGSFVAISSIASYRGTPNSGAYSASKAAVNVWTESLRLRLMPYGISVTTICMGFVNTAMTADLPFWMPGILSSKKAAFLIAEKIRKKTRLTILPWQSRIIWNGFRVMPGFVYDRLILWAKANGPKR